MGYGLQATDASARKLIELANAFEAVQDGAFEKTSCVAHTDKLEGYKQMPDGLVRVIGLKLK